MMGMVKDKKEVKKAMTLRIKPNCIEDYDNILKEMFGEHHRKKGVMFEELVKQLAQQDPIKLREYYEKNKAIINLSEEQIIDKEKQIEEVKEEITRKDDIIKDYETRVNEKEEIIEDKNKTIIEKEKQIKELEKINKKFEDTINTMQNTVETLNNTIDTSNKDVKTARNDYKHIVEALNKLQVEYNEIQNENKQYAIKFTEIKKMSLIERILGKYPDDIKELTSPK